MNEEILQELLKNIKLIEADESYNVYTKNGFYDLNRLSHLLERSEVQILDDNFIAGLRKLRTIYHQATSIGHEGNGSLSEWFVERMLHENYIVMDHVIPGFGDEAKSAIVTRRGTLVFD
jgi:hypothetical protein